MLSHSILMSFQTLLDIIPSLSHQLIRDIFTPHLSKKKLQQSETGLSHQPQLPHQPQLSEGEKKKKVGAGGWNVRHILYLSPELRFPLSSVSPLHSVLLHGSPRWAAISQTHLLMTLSLWTPPLVHTLRLLTKAPSHSFPGNPASSLWPSPPRGDWAKGIIPELIPFSISDIAQIERHLESLATDQATFTKNLST